MELNKSSNGDEHGIVKDHSTDLPLKASRAINQNVKPDTKRTEFEITLEPYSVNTKDNKDRNFKPNNKRQKFKPNTTLTHFDSIFGSDDWSRFLVFKTESKITKQKLENYLLSSYPTKDMSFRLLRENEWLVEASTKNQSENYLLISKIDNINITVLRHETMNSIQGTVVLPEDDEPIDRKTILDSLKKRYNNIENMEIYEIPSKRNKEKPLKIAKIKFQGQNIPQKIKILGENRELRPYVPKPLQCKNCSRYGHTTKKCRSNPVCAFCASAEHETLWNKGTQKCVNCGQNHHARSKSCPFYIYNTELKLLQERTGMTVKEAKLELKVRGLIDPAKKPMYRSVIHNHNPNVNNSSKPKSESKIQKKDSLQRSLENFEITDGDNSEQDIMKARHKSCEDLRTLNRRTSFSIENKNPFNVLLDLENDDDKVYPGPSKLKYTTSDKEFHGNKKRPLERTPPKNKRQNVIDVNIPPFKNKSKSHEIITNEKIKTAKNLPKAGIYDDNTYESQEIPSYDETTDQPSKNIVSAEIHNNQNLTQPESTSEIKKGKDDLINPSPIIETRIKCLDKIHLVKAHEDSCGCNMCFINLCKRNDITKDSLINIIRNFISNRNKLSTDIDTHEEGCMCVNHLIHYKEQHIHILDNFLTKMQRKDEPNSENTSSNKIDYSVKQKPTSNYSRKNPKTAINRKNNIMSP